MLAQLLTEMDGLVSLNNVTIIAATNRPDILDNVSGCGQWAWLSLASHVFGIGPASSRKDRQVNIRAPPYPSSQERDIRGMSCDTRGMSCDTVGTCHVTVCLYDFVYMR